jgi:hypothetical protein
MSFRKLRSSRWALLGFAVALAGGLATWIARPRMSDSALYERTIGSTVLVDVDSTRGSPACMGSGFYVSPHLLMTCAHVVGAAESCAVYPEVSRADSVLRGRIVFADTLADIAVIYTDSSATPLSLRHDVAEIGEPVLAIGSPYGYMGSLSTGVVSQRRKDRESKVGLVQCTNEIGHGSSGGPLIDRAGRVVGMIASGSEENSYAFAIDTEALAAALRTTLGAYESLGGRPDIASLMGWADTCRTTRVRLDEADLAFLDSVPLHPDPAIGSDLSEFRELAFIPVLLVALGAVVWNRHRRLRRIARESEARTRLEALRAAAFLPDDLIATELRRLAT